MRKQTVLLLIILAGVFSLAFFVVNGGNVTSTPLLAEVGIALGVAPNPYNTLDAQLNQKQDELNQQASSLAAEEAAFASSTAAAQAPSPVVWYLSVATFILTVLVVLNFYLDWRRSKREPSLAPLDLSDIEQSKE